MLRPGEDRRRRGSRGGASIRPRLAARRRRRFRRSSTTVSLRDESAKLAIADDDQRVDSAVGSGPKAENDALR